MTGRILLHLQEMKEGYSGVNNADGSKYEGNPCAEQMMIRRIRDDEVYLLRDFLYEAIFIPGGVTPPPREIVERPELALYYRDFGTGRGDFCVVADDGKRIAGAAWSRIMNDYGHVDDDTPSLAISLYKEYRGQGTGTEMLRELLKLLAREGFERASLAVQKDNYAVRMYENAGFRTVGENSEEYIMVADLRVEKFNKRKYNEK